MSRPHFVPASILLIALTILTGACAGGASPGTSAPAEPLAWPAGEYLLEGTVSYDAGIGRKRDTHVARLWIDAEGNVALESETSGVCTDPTPAELQRDRRRQRRTFRCGDVTYVIQPSSTTVHGELIAWVEEDRTVTRCTVNATGQRVCRTTVVSERVRKDGPLRVSLQS